jgi:adenylosuccinate synthase
MTSIVLGLGFGDEGKGSVVSHLVSARKDCIVIRFNGGHQAGHTVVKDGVSHIFSNFGSGTLHGAPTFWSRECTVDPVGLIREYTELTSKCKDIKLYLDPLCPVVTPYDVLQNVTSVDNLNHGTVGVGFGTTIDRQETPYTLYVKDILHPRMFWYKVEQIRKYYGSGNLNTTTFETAVSAMKFFLEEENSWLVMGDDCIRTSKNIVFEGAQGILLDQDHGFFPHVTRSNTTSHNALALVTEYGLPIPDIFYVTRSYSTRHGNGPLEYEGIYDFTLKNTENESNVKGDYQGEFRKSVLDVDLLKYAVETDRAVSYSRLTSTLCVTCLDQTGDTFWAVVDGELKKFTAEKLGRLLNTNYLMVNFDPAYSRIYEDY